MKIEYLLDGSPDCPLVRLYEFAPSEVSALRLVCGSLHDGSLDEHSLDVQSIGGCQLKLKAGSRDQGLVLVALPASFEWILSRSTWDNIDGLLEPFEESGVGGFQWLDQSGGPSHLISRDGIW